MGLGGSKVQRNPISRGSMQENELLRVGFDKLKRAVAGANDDLYKRRIAVLEQIRRLAVDD